MNTIGIFYGSTTGKTQEIAEAISSKLQNCELIDVSKANKEDLTRFDNLILATSTYGDGELQTDWEDFATKLSEDDLMMLAVDSGAEDFEAEDDVYQITTARFSFIIFMDRIW